MRAGADSWIVIQIVYRLERADIPAATISNARTWIVSLNDGFDLVFQIAADFSFADPRPIVSQPCNFDHGIACGFGFAKAVAYASSCREVSNCPTMKK